MGELPANWAFLPLENCGEWGSGGTPTRTNPLYYRNGTIPWLIIGDLNNGVVTRASTYITEAGLRNSSAKLLPINTLLIGMYGSIGKLGITGIECATNQAIAYCKPNTDIALLKFLFYVLMNSKDSLLSQGQGGAQQNINQEILKRYNIPLAPLNEQKRIAEKLDSLLARVNSCQSHLERVPQILKRFRQSVLAAAMSGELTEEWRKKKGANGKWQETTIGEIAEVFLGRQRSPENHFGDYMRKYVRAANVTWNGWDLSDVKEMNFAPRDFERYHLRVGDVLLNEGSGSADEVGKPAIWNDEIEDCCFQNTLLCVRPYTALSKYLYYLLLYTAMAKLFVKNVRGVNIFHIGKEKLANFEILIPSLEEQSEIVRRIENLFTCADLLEARYQSARLRLRQLTPSLLAKAFRGELVEQDLIDEPAKKLLERIKKQRAARPDISKRVPKSKEPREIQMTEDTLRDVIRKLPKDNFTFDDLRENFPGDYEQLKAFLFILLSEHDPVINQVFDQSVKAMRFVRGSK
jgi:type I restriction enzyme, S subunit